MFPSQRLDEPVRIRCSFVDFSPPFFSIGCVLDPPVAPTQALLFHSFIYHLEGIFFNISLSPYSPTSGPTVFKMEVLSYPFPA